jgi:hypothetical protein
MEDHPLRARRTFQRFVTAVAAVVALASAGSLPALAGPPFQTDDPEPTPYRHYEIYANSQFAHDGGGMNLALPSIEVNYGLMPNVQFSFTVTRAGNREVGERWRAGFGDMDAGLKIRFVQETATMPQIAFYPSVSLPSGDANLGLGDGTPKLFLPLWAQKSVGKWTVFGGGGLWRNPGPGNRNYTFTGVAVERELSESLSFGAEIFHASASTLGGDAPTGFNVGMTKSLDEHHKVLFSVGRGLRGGNTLSTYAAYELNLGPKSKAGVEAPEH